MLVLLASYSIIGTLIPQGQEAAYYASVYPTWSSLMLMLQMDKVYTSLVFGILVVLFVVNLAGCTVIKLPAQMHRMKKDFFPTVNPDATNFYDASMDEGAFLQALKKRRYHLIESEEGIKAYKHKAGNLGPAVTHLGIIIIILGGFLGSLFATEGFFNLLPGDIKAFPEDEFHLGLEDFYLEFRDDGSVAQYYSDLIIIENNGETRKETIWVNNPLNYKKKSFYQASYGWASNLLITDRDGEVLESGWLRNGESYFYQPEHLNVFLYGYFPDMVVTDSGMPISMTEKENNPYYALILYHFGENVGSYVLEPGQTITHDDLVISFSESKLYTGITYRQDFSYIFIVLGSIVILLGMALAFYFYPKFIHLDKSKSSLRVHARQNLWGLENELKGILSSINNKGDTAK